MDRHPVLLDEELAMQTVEFLPARETLWAVNVANVIGVNVSLAINAASIGTSASSLAGQQLSAVQY
jgi:hypothetical protein